MMLLTPSSNLSVMIVKVLFDKLVELPGGIVTRRKIR